MLHENNIQGFGVSNMCTEAKEAHEILKTAHVGTFKVRMSRLQLLIVKFENLRMKRVESISDFNIILHDISKTYFAFREGMSKEKIA